MPRFAPVAPHRPIYRTLGVLIGFCILFAGIVLLSPRLFRQCMGCVFPFPMPSGLCHKEDVVSYSAYATVSVEDQIAVVGMDKRECRTHILRGVVHVLLKCAEVIYSTL